MDATAHGTRRAGTCKRLRGRLGLKSPLARRLVVSLVLVSSLLALILTLIQLYTDFRHEAASIREELLLIEKSFDESLTRSVWTLNDQQIMAQLDGIVDLPHIVSAYISIDGRTRWRQGLDPATLGLGRGSRLISHRFHLNTEYKGHQRDIGTVSIVASLDSVYKHLINKGVLILVANGFKTSVVVLVVFLLFQFMVTRRLDALARHAQAIELGEEPPPLPPSRPADDPRTDEIDHVVHALADMQQRLDAAYRDQAQLNTELRDEATRHEQSCRELAALSASLEDKVQERTQALRASNRELESFVYAVSHDLRAPLRSIIGFSQALEEDSSEIIGDEGRQHLQRVRASALRMGQLIDDLLKLSRISQGELRPRRVDLSAIAEKIAEQLRQADPERRVEFDIQPGIQAWGDPGLLRIALDNLLGNAWKYTAGCDIARIEFGCRREGERQICHVKDNGAGFDMRYAERLFVPFQRLHHQGEFPGEGIGLATVARVINRHGGQIWAEAEPHKGATFYFTLPEESGAKGRHRPNKET